MTNIHRAVALFAVLFLCWIGRPADAEVFRQLQRDSAVSAPGANTDFITDITWAGGDGEIMRIQIQCEASTIVNVMINDGSNEIDHGLNANTALVAGATYVFDVQVRSGDVINLQCETDSIIDHVSIGAVQ